MIKTVGFYTLGCKVNQYESQSAAKSFADAGYRVVTEQEPADVYVVNTCTITQLADRKSRQYIRRMKRLNPAAVMVVMGCYPQTNPLEVSAIQDVDIIVGTDDKGKIVEFVSDFVENGKAQNHVRVISALESQYTEESSFIGLDSKTRALIKIQDGCDRFCSYCVIPYSRGAIRSRPLKNIVQEAEYLIDKGYKELVLTGINTALYGAEKGFPHALDGSSGVESIVKSLNALSGDFRIRLGSLEPTVVNAVYVEKLLGYEKLCHHLHLSVQSGSDKILRAMNRNYTIADYLEIIKVIRDFDPHYGITTDIITGFPGETERDFQDSIELVQQVGYLKVHAFPYSRRLYTSAAQMEAQIAAPIKKERNRQLIQIAGKASETYRQSLQGSLQRVLVEDSAGYRQGQHLWRGHSDNFTEVYFPCSQNSDLTNQFVHIIAVQPLEDGVLGRKESPDV